ncbi:hypothetical protein WR25_09940 isoform B [Diploscapter pachys]|uniref:Uncharacterized protein n=1 Tax=Diploscapter pachys TaxID=2018661 RepID=A0A2A2J180_9BILA|nr:hypothetical protein WR25_09940 isoform B [Diploscapter pachys]
MQGSPDRKPLLAQAGLISYDTFVATKDRSSRIVFPALAKYFSLVADHIWSLKSIKPELKRLDKSIELLHLRLKTLEETVHFYETILDNSDYLYEVFKFKYFDTPVRDICQNLPQSVHDNISMMATRWRIRVSREPLLIEYTQVKTENVFLKDELNKQAERHVQTDKVTRLVQAIAYLAGKRNLDYSQIDEPITKELLVRLAINLITSSKVSFRHSERHLHLACSIRIRIW